MHLFGVYRGGMERKESFSCGTRRILDGRIVVLPVKKTIFATLNKDEFLKRWKLYAHIMSGLIGVEADILTP